MVLLSVGILLYERNKPANPTPGQAGLLLAKP